MTAFSGIPYFNSVSGQASLTSIAFYRNIGSRVRGADREIAAKPFTELSLGLNLSYSKNESKGGLIPCTVTAALTGANSINFSQSAKGQTLNTQAPFQATANGSYDIPLTSSFDGYFRFNVNFQGKNPNFCNFPTNGNFLQTKSLALVDLFASLAGHQV